MFQYAEMLNLPDGLLDIVDEFSEARDEALRNEVSCEQVFDNCPSETIVHIRSKIKDLLQWVQARPGQTWVKRPRNMFDILLGISAI